MILESATDARCIYAGTEQDDGRVDSPGADNNMVRFELRTIVEYHTVSSACSNAYSGHRCLGAHG